MWRFIFKAINRRTAFLNTVNQMGLWWTTVAKRSCLRVLSAFVLLQSVLRLFFPEDQMPKDDVLNLTNETNTKQDEELPAQTVCLKVMQIHTRPLLLICFCVLCFALYLHSQLSWAAGRLLCFSCLTRCSGISSALWHLLACFSSTEGFRFTSLSE